MQHYQGLFRSVPGHFTHLGYLVVYLLNLFAREILFTQYLSEGEQVSLGGFQYMPLVIGHVDVVVQGRRYPAQLLITLGLQGGDRDDPA